MTTVNFTRGANGKPVATQALQESLSRIGGVSGECFFGYPLIATPEGKYFLDGTLVSPEKGIVLFDLVEGTDVGDYAARQDDLANKIEAKLKLHKELVKGRKLIPGLQVITFAPAVEGVERLAVEGYPIANEKGLAHILGEFAWGRLQATNSIASRFPPWKACRPYARVARSARSPNMIRVVPNSSA